jgi:hypothetical protein
MTEYEDRQRRGYAGHAEGHEAEQEEPREEVQGETEEESQEQSQGQDREDSSDERPEAGERRSFFQRLLFGDGDDEDGDGGGSGRNTELTGARELEDPEEPRELHGFTVERAASVIKDMPDDVPRKSAVRIVRQTLAAASIEVGELDRATRMREAKLESRIELSRGRVDELNERTDEVINSLQDQIEKAREARDYGVSEEERKISESRDGLSDVDLVRDFFDIRVAESRSESSSDQISGVSKGLEDRDFWSERYQEPEGHRGREAEREDPTEDHRESYREDETQIMDPVEDDTQVIGDRGPRYAESGDEGEPRDNRG